MSRIAPGTLIVLIFAILFGLVAAFAIQRQLAEKPKPAPVTPEDPAPRVIRIPLASADIEAGRPITLGDVAMVSGTMEQLKARYNLPGEYMSNANQIIGRTLRNPLAKASTFAPDDFYPEGTGPSVADLLKPGLRAVTIPAEGAAAINGFASPSSSVDVLFQMEGSKDQPETTVTLIEAVEVLALDRTLQAGVHGRDVATVTLAVTLEQANALKIAEPRGSFSLALRNPNDDSLTVSSTGPQTLDELLNLPNRRVPFKAEIFRGSSKSSMQFSRPPVARDVKVTTPIPGLPREPQNDDAADLGNDDATRIAVGGP